MVTPKNCTKMHGNLTFVVQFAYFTIRPKKFLFFSATFVTKSNVVLFFERLLINSFKRRYRKIFVKSQAICAKPSNTKKNWTTSLHSITLKIMLNNVTICKLQISSSLRAIINRNDDPVLQDFSWVGRTLRQVENLLTNSWSYTYSYSDVRRNVKAGWKENFSQRQHQ